ncbi:ankyrin [Morchella conica CCBAS932]|uniref:Ankyrin n=1 Tax=Morchella conica CCBAS932 TaxID=1392247 RepID=A0A3N4KVW9_9PEZI|nr:ankyrin [Morchella conica CCBAS932]
MTSATSPIRGLALGREASDDTSMNQSPFSPNCTTNSPPALEGSGSGSDSTSSSKRSRITTGSGSGSGSLLSSKRARISEDLGSGSGSAPEWGPGSDDSMPSPPKSMTLSDSPGSSPPVSPPQLSVSPISYVWNSASSGMNMGTTPQALVLKDVKEVPAAIYILSEFPDMIPVYNQTRANYPSFFLWIARVGNYPAVKFLIEEKAAAVMEINTFPRGANRTALHYAAFHGHLDMLNYLLDYMHNDDIEVDYVQDRSGFTALHLACINPAIETIRLLLGHPWGNSPHIRANCLSTALHIAARSADEDIVELIIEAGADFNAVNSSGYTPLMIAAENGNGKAIVKLAEYELDLDRQTTFGGDTALHFAVRGGFLQVTKYLLRMGADCHVVNLFSKTVLDYTLEDILLSKREKESCKKIMAILEALANDSPDKWALINHEDDMVARAQPVSDFDPCLIERPRGPKSCPEDLGGEWEIDMW